MTSDFKFCFAALTARCDLAPQDIAKKNDALLIIKCLDAGIPPGKLKLALDLVYGES